eukprot:gene3190-3994_t
MTSLIASDISKEDPEQLFRVLEVIGQGSFGVVCSCINTQSNEVVAIKFLEMEADENSSLKKEITILKNTAILVNTGCKQKSLVGSPYWMSPEVISPPKGSTGYDSKADIWSLGITAIEMAESKPPHFNLYPLKVLFIIPFRNSPTLEKPENWSKEFNDFITLCLNKEADKRPTAKDLLNHPFIQKGKENSAEIISEMVDECIPLMQEYRRKKAEEEEEDSGDAGNSAGVQKGTLLKVNTTTQTATIMNEKNTTKASNGGTFIHNNNNNNNNNNAGTVVFSSRGNTTDDMDDEDDFDSGSV